MNFLRILEPRKMQFVRKCTRILSVRSVPDWIITSTSKDQMTVEEVSDLVKIKWGILIEPCFKLMEIFLSSSSHFAAYSITGKQVNFDYDYAFDSSQVEKKYQLVQVVIHMLLATQVTEDSGYKLLFAGISLAKALVNRENTKLDK